ncbi:MAG: glycine zipper 2TM domain-containing protein [Marinicellaceae bacterium]
MKTYKTLLTTMAFIAASNVNAGRYNNDYDYAQVVDVQTIYETYQVPQNRQVCRDNPRSHRHSNRSNAGGAVLGGIIGGLIGNRFGKGSGRDAATAAGILTGAAIGSNSKNRGRYHSGRQCYTETQYYDEQRVAGYDVSYDYNGRIYQTRMQNHPGSRVKVVINVQPAGY